MQNGAVISAWMGGSSIATMRTRAPGSMRSPSEITVPSHEIAQGVAQRQDDSKGWKGQLVDFAYFLNTASRLAGFAVRSLAQRSPTS